MPRVTVRAWLPVVSLLLAGPLHADITIPSADGSDGVFAPTQSVVVDLDQAVPGSWSSSNAGNAGKGIYDSEKWAVVYKYSGVNIGPGVTVQFKNHRSHAPVVWLVSGDVTIGPSAVIRLAGEDQQSGTAADRPTEPGPGGFRGGAAGSVYSPAGPGGGPGASHNYASYGTLGYTPAGSVYGNPQILPLIGGSGGGGLNPGYSGGAGGGAILIAATGTITVTGYVNAMGGNGQYFGSGGAIRLLADKIIVQQQSGLNALGGGGHDISAGRIRLEANSFSLAPISPAPSTAPPAAIPVLFPPSQPKTVITKIDTVSASGDPQSAFSQTNSTVLNIAKTTAVKVTIAASNVPSTWTMSVRSAPRNGQEVSANATRISGDDVSSVWTADIVLPLGYNALQVHAVKP